MSSEDIIFKTVNDLYDIDLLPIDATRSGLAQVAQAAEPVFDTAVSVLQVIGGIATFILLLALIAIKRKAKEIPVPGKVAEPTIGEIIAPPTPAEPGAYAARWAEVLKHLDSAQEAQWKLAVMEADKLIDLVLQRGGFPGATLGERLMNMQPGQLISLDGLWEAHKVRNHIAHTMDYFLRYSEAKRIIGLYERALHELEAI